ncbi:hypothetical protein ACKWTF_016271 [Chironomus riparius]
MKKPSKTPPKLSKNIWTEIKFFASFFDRFGEKSSLHGFKYIFSSKLNIFERLMWLILFILTSYAAYSISSTQYERYVANPTVISLERDYREWNGTLPAITICYHKRIDDKRAKEVIKKLWNLSETDDDFQYFYDFIKTIVYLNESFKDINQFTNDRRLDDIDLLGLARDVHPIFNSVVSSFDSSAEFKLNEVITEKGICYTVNSVLWPLMSTGKVNHNSINLNAKPLSCYFLKNQCYMKLDVYDPTIFIALHSPFEVPAENTPFFDIGVTDEIEASYNMLETVASDELRKLRIAQRKCYFIDESSDNLPVYSFNACKMMCRAKTALRLCGCKPYFYPFLNGTTCTALGHLCLNVNHWPIVASCDCSKTCVEIVYTQNSLKKIN